MPVEPRRIDLRAAVLVTLLTLLWAGNSIATEIGLTVPVLVGIAL